MQSAAALCESPTFDTVPHPICFSLAPPQSLKRRMLLAAITQADQSHTSVPTLRWPSVASSASAAIHNCTSLDLNPFSPFLFPHPHLASLHRIEEEHSPSWSTKSCAPSFFVHTNFDSAQEVAFTQKRSNLHEHTTDPTNAA
jgi:hypothetical protein